MELIVAVNLLQALLVVGVLVFLRRQLRSRALDHWSIAWLAVCGRYGVLFVEQVRGPSTLLGTLEVLGALVQAWFFLLGAAHLAGRALPRPLIAVPIAVASWAVVAPALALPPLASDLPVYLGLSLALVAAGVTLFRHGPEAIGARTVSVALVLFGIHVADRPFLADVPAVAPYGYALAVLLQSAVGLGMLAVAFELSVQKVARAERRYRRIFENVPEGIFRTTPEGRFAAANPALVEMLGYGSFEELSAVCIPDAIYLDPDERAAMQAEYEEQGELAGYETIWRRRDGEPIRVMLSGRVMRDEAGGILGYEGLVRDVTARRRMQEAVGRAQRMEAVGRLAGGLAHDFNNLLMVVQATADELDVALGEDHPLRPPVKDLQAASERATRLSRKLLELSRGRVEGRSERVSLGQAVEGAADLLRRIVGAGVELEVVAEDAVWVEVDPGALEQVLLNLAMNARDAMGEEGGHLRVEVDALRLGKAEAERLGLQVGRWARLRVVDDGPGMDAETRARIFEPFFTTRRESGGTGLGLATVYAAVQRAGGSIDVESQPGEGATFIVYLRRRAGASSELRPAPVSERRRRWALVLEDEAAIRSAVRRILERQGWQCVEAASGAELEALGEERLASLDLVLSDVMLGAERGPQLVKGLRERDPGLAVLYMSGFAPAQLEETELGDAPLLAKPFTARELLDALEQLVGAPPAGAEETSGHAEQAEEAERPARSPSAPP